MDSTGRFGCAAVSLLMLLAAAGCAAPAESASVPSAAASAVPEPENPKELKDLPGYITGTIVDPELVPIFEVDVVVTPGDLVTLTNSVGQFQVGPLSEGQYTVVAEKRGYTRAEAKVSVSESRPNRVNLVLEPVASDVPYHETLTETMYLICHVVLPNPTSGGTILNAPCGAVDLVTGTTNTIDKWKFPFRVEKPGFMSLLMEMTWAPQQFGKDGLMQLTYKGKAAVNQAGGVTVSDTVYGDSMANPFHAIIHAGNSYWVSGGKNVTFYPNPNETSNFEMLIAGGGGNNTVPNFAIFVEFKPTAYLTLYYNRRAPSDATILPDR